MKAYNSITYILLTISSLFLLSCGSTKTETDLRFQPAVGNPYLDSYYLYLTDSTLKSIPQMRKNYQSAQSAEIADLIAQTYYQHGIADSAEKYIAQAYALDSNVVTYTRKYYSILEETNRNPEKLLTLAHRLIALDSTDAKNQYSLLMAYIRNNQYDSAIRYATAHRDYFRRYFEIDMLLTNLYLQTQQPDSALTTAQDLVAFNPTEADNHFFASTVAARCDDTLRYKQYFKSGVRYGCPDTRLTEAYVQYMLQSHQNEELIPTLDSIMTQCHYPTPWIIEMLGNLRFLFKKEVVESATGGHLFSRFEEQLDSSSDGQFLLLQYYRRFEDTAEILASLESNCKKFAPSYIWNVLKISEELKYKPAPTLQNWNEETKTLRENIANYPFDLFSAFVYFEYVGGVVDSVQRIDTIDHYIDVYKQLLRKSKRGAVYRFPLTFQQDTSLNQRQVLRNNISRLYGYKGDLTSKHESSFIAYKQALKYNKDNEVVLNNYAYNLALSDERKLATALRMSQRSIEIDPKNVNYLDTYGYILYRLKRYKEAKAVFVKLLTIDPNPGKVSLLHYSDVLEALGNKDAAEVYRMKAENNPNQ